MAHRRIESWDDFKDWVAKRQVTMQETVLSDGYLIEAFDGPLGRSIKFRNEDHATEIADYENNYQATHNVTYTDSTGHQLLRIQEEDIPTGGHYQAQGYEVDVADTDTTKTLNISFPHPVSLLAAEWNNKAAFDGDSIQMAIPYTTIGAIGANVSSSDTVITVSSTVIDNMRIGGWVKITDGVNADDLGRCLSIDETNSQITVETAATQAFSAASPTYVQMQVRMLPKSPLDGVGRVQLGESKIGGSYIPPNTTFEIIYYNDTGTAKKLRFMMEYLY